MIEANRIEEVAERATGWGYAGVAEAIASFNAGLATDPQTLDPPRQKWREPLITPPYLAVEVSGGITFPFAGLKIDARAHVLGEGAMSSGVVRGRGRRVRVPHAVRRRARAGDDHRPVGRHRRCRRSP